METNEFLKVIKEKGWIKFDNIIPADFVATINKDLEIAYQTCRSVQIKNGIDANTDGTVHHVLGLADSFLQIIENMYLHDHIAAYFDNPYIINSYGGVINMPKKLSYVGNIHRDIRTFYNVPMMINMLIMLDDFTPENGATYMLSGSNNIPERPTDEDFYKNADRVVGKAGDVVLFDSLVWHAAGENQTDKVRRALTLTFTRPFMKQQLDYPRCLGYDKGENFSENARQVIGYNSRTPTSLEEWYQPPNKRFYRPGQG
jgi:hypothetical protein